MRLGHERDHVGQLGDCLEITERGEALQAERVQLVAHQQREVRVFGTDDPRGPVVKARSLQDHLEEELVLVGRLQRRRWAQPELGPQRAQPSLGFSRQLRMSDLEHLGVDRGPAQLRGGLGAGQARVALSVRGIGEGHISSIGFCSAVVGPGAQWSFEPRLLPVSVADTTPAAWHRAHLQAVLADQGPLDELGQAVLHALPAEFQGVDLERALAEAHRDLLTRAGSAATVDLLRKVVSSAYSASFDRDVELGQRILSPSAAEESNGMEDARFTRFAGDDGTTEYRATYTAYDGQRIAPRLLISSELRVFSAHRLAGPAARNKGMAVFPRKVHGRYLALCRSDGESTSLARSADGYVWDHAVTLQEPSAPWEMLQVGNCGPPIETDQGWLVLTHGVGPMRVYVIGALLLDLDDPARVLGSSRTPLLSPGRDEQDGYVPNVVYSCGAFLHDGLVWIPYGIDDCRIGVAYAPLGEVLADMSSAS